MKIKFSNVVKMFLAGACFVAVGCTDYGQDIENLNNRIDALETDRITPLETDLAAVKSALEAAKKDLQDKIKANADAIEELEGALTELEAKAADYEEHKEAYEALVQSHKTKIAALEGEIEALKKKDSELAGLIETLDKQVKQNTKDIADNKALLDATINTLNLLQDAHTALATKVDGLEAAFAKHQADIRKELDEHYAAFSDYTKKTDKALADLVAKHDAQQILIEANQKAIADTNDELAKAKKELEESIATTNKVLADYKLEMADIIKGLENDIEANGKDIKVNAKAIEDLQGVVGTLSSKVDTIEKNLNDLTEKVNNFIESATKDIEALKGRIQSLVFVPEHKDGKATIHWAQLGTTLVEAQSVLKFQVSPAECAEALTNAEDLSFVFTEALASTRTNVPALNVVGVAVADVKKGIIAVTVNARNLGQSFYDGDTNYAVSLVLENKSVNIASCYVHLAPATPNVIDVKLINDTAEQYTIEYTNTTLSHVILPEHKFQFSIDGNGAKTIEGMLEDGYDIVVVKNAPTFEFSAPNTNTKNVFKNVVDDTTNPYLNFVTVSLSEAAKEAVNGVETVTYSYNVCGKPLTASATVKVIKIQRAITMNGADIVWNYAEDAKSDAGLDVTNSVDIATIVDSTLPDDVTYEYVLNNATPVVTVTVDGNVATGVTAELAGTNAAPTVALTNFAWGKTYTIKAVYELESIDVTITVTVNTVDRLRDEIVVDLVDSEYTIAHETSYTFTNSLVNVDELKGEATIFDQIVANKTNVGDMTAAAFLKEVLDTKKNAKYAVVNTFNGALATDTTNLTVGAEGVEATVNFSYVDVTTMPSSVKHIYTVTTWYGQVITITKTVNLVLPGTYDFIHIDEWVTTDLAGNYYSKVLAEYDYQPETLSSLFSFNTKKVDMESAFDVVNGDVVYKTKAEAEAAHIYQEFVLTPNQGALKSEFNGLKLDYKDYNKDLVYVTGKLYLDVKVGTTTEKKELATSFSTPLYSKYYVQRMEFEDKFDVVAGTLYLDNAKPYYIDLRSRVQLTDNRPNAAGLYSLLQYTVGETVFYNRDEALNVIANNPDLNITDVLANFTQGNGQNGFATGKSADAVYMPFKLAISLDFDSVPVGLRNATQTGTDESKLKFNPDTFSLFVDGSAQLNLTKPVDLEFDVKLMYDDVVYKEKTVTITLKPLQNN